MGWGRSAPEGSEGWSFPVLHSRSLDAATDNHLHSIILYAHQLGLLLSINFFSYCKLSNKHMQVPNGHAASYTLASQIQHNSISVALVVIKETATDLCPSFQQRKCAHTDLSRSM